MSPTLYSHLPRAHAVNFKGIPFNPVISRSAYQQEESYMMSFVVMRNLARNTEGCIVTRVSCEWDLGDWGIFCLAQETKLSGGADLASFS